MKDGMTDFIIHCSPASDWYIGFRDKNGVSRLLPACRRSWWRSWKMTNCPKDPSPRWPVVIVSDGCDENLTPDDALKSFKEKFSSVEEYLGWLNG